MAAGFATSEEYLVKHGIPQTLDFDTYHLLRFGDVPAIDVVFLENADPLGPYGAKGLGEPATLAAAPAIVNAISDATGLFFNSVPVNKKLIIKRLTESGRQA